MLSLDDLFSLKKKERERKREKKNEWVMEEDQNSMKMVSGGGWVFTWSNIGPWSVLYAGDRWSISVISPFPDRMMVVQNGCTIIVLNVRAWSWWLHGLRWNYWWKNNMAIIQCWRPRILNRSFLKRFNLGDEFECGRCDQIVKLGDKFHRTSYGLYCRPCFQDMQY